MPTTVGAYEAKTHLPRLLALAEAGEEVTITKHGRPIARLVPATETSSPIEEVLAELLAVRATLEGAFDIRELIEEGRRL
jgi:prevent-host-death family protein